MWKVGNSCCRRAASCCFFPRVTTCTSYFFFLLFKLCLEKRDFPSRDGMETIVPLRAFIASRVKEETRVCVCPSATFISSLISRETELFNFSALKAAAVAPVRNDEATNVQRHAYTLGVIKRRRTRLSITLMKIKPTAGSTRRQDASTFFFFPLSRSRSRFLAPRRYRRGAPALGITRIL